MLFPTFARQFAMPLLGKELVEQAARKRTYALRVVYAALLFAGFGLTFFDVLRAGLGPGAQGVLGRGLEMFQEHVRLQFLGILVFLPAMMAGVVTTEKERRSLELLFLTDLRPWSIVWQKYLGRLVPMFTFLVLSLPLMAVAYGFGGISQTYLLSGMVLLFLTCLQVGAFALMCSTYCRTTVGSLLAAYLGGALFYVSVPLLVWFLAASYGEGDVSDLGDALFLFPPYVFDHWGSETPAVVALSIPILVTTALFLVLARAHLVRRAVVPPRHRLGALFSRLDCLFTKLNRRMGGVLFLREPNPLPGRDPVAWRELQKRPLGRVNHLIRILLAVETLVVALISLLVFGASFHDAAYHVTVMASSLWVVAALVLTVQGANAIAAERTRQTLDALLTTPLSGQEIVRQKMRRLMRLMIVFAVPLLTVSVLRPWWESSSSRWWRLGLDTRSGALSLVAPVLCVVVYLPMIAWISLWIGLKVRAQFRATMVALCVIVCWCIVPPLIWIVLYDAGVPASGNLGVVDFFWLASPASAVARTLFNAWGEIISGREGILIILNFCFYGTILYLVRRACIRRADYYLRKETNSGE